MSFLESWLLTSSLRVTVNIIPLQKNFLIIVY